MPFSPDETIWTDFLNAWPIERLSKMTLAEYSTRGDKDCFVYWMESRLEDFGSIWGGSAFKFGIYSRRSTTQETAKAGRTYDEQYGWYTKYGSDRTKAFDVVRRNVVAVAEAARDGRLEAIDEVDLGDTYKWKIAFHYQSRETPSIVCIFSPKALAFEAGLPRVDRRMQLSELYRRVSAGREPSESIVAWSARLWQDWSTKNPLSITLSAAVLRQGLLKINLGSSPFPEAMVGGESPDELGDLARFETDTGDHFESDIRARTEESSSGVLRHSLLTYFAAVGAKEGDTLVVTPTGEGTYCIALKGYTPSAAQPMDRVPTAVPVAATYPRSTDTPPLNQILFGPPGTGKTYHTIDKALEILDPAFLRANAEDRAALKARFDTQAREGLVQFVTFHQSFSYEDFVEGLRAESDGETRALSYEVVDGVFKRLCEAAQVRVVQEAPVPFDVTGRRIWKLSLGDAITEPHIYRECIDNGYALLGYGAGLDFAGCTTRDDIRAVLRDAGQSAESTDFAVTAANAFVLQMKPGDLVVVSEGNLKFRAIGEVTGDYRRLARPEGDTYAQCRDVRWLRVYSTALPIERLMDVRFSQATIYELRDGSINMAKLRALLQPQEPVAEVNRPRVLIIDEINRGNVSRIFGELITLVEPSKRAGAAESLEVVLPYSKTRFSVPANVHLIGTMNTADRSLAGVDIALRRRFQFVEMPPRPDFLKGRTIAGVDLGQLLTTMNHRIEALLDRDHQLGHAYFMELANGDSIAGLAAVFRQQILPLLQEYFFEDWERIRWVLNDQRKLEGCRFVVEQGLNGAALFGDGVTVDARAKLWRLDSSAFDNVESYRGIISTLSA